MLRGTACCIFLGWHPMFPHLPRCRVPGSCCVARIHKLGHIDISLPMQSEAFDLFGGVVIFVPEECFNRVNVERAMRVLSGGQDDFLSVAERIAKFHKAVWSFSRDVRDDYRA